MIVWLPALVSAAPGTAAPVSAVFEGVWSPYLEEGDVPGIDYVGNKVTVTCDDGSTRVFKFISYEDGDGVVTRREFREDGDPGKEQMSVSMDTEGGLLKPGNNRVRFSCWLNDTGQTVFTDYVTIYAHPLITDLQFVPVREDMQFWSIAGYGFVAGNEPTEPGNKLIVTYRDGTSAEYIAVLYRYRDPVYENMVSDIGYFENGEVTFDPNGWPNSFGFWWEPVGGDTFTAGPQQVRCYTSSGGERIYSSGTYDVEVYHDIAGIEFNTPEPLPVTLVKNDYVIDYYREGAYITITNEDGTVQTYRPAKIKGENGDEPAFTLNGEDYAESLILSFNPVDPLRHGLNTVSVDIERHNIVTGDDVQVYYNGRGPQSMTVKGKTYTVRYARLKKAKYKKYFAVNRKTGRVTVRKGLRKGTYKVKITVKAAGNTSYKPASGTATATIRVK